MQVNDDFCSIISSIFISSISLRKALIKQGAVPSPSSIIQLPHELAEQAAHSPPPSTPASLAMVKRHSQFLEI